MFHSTNFDELLKEHPVNEWLPRLSKLTSEGFTGVERSFSALRKLLFRNLAILVFACLGAFASAYLIFVKQTPLEEHAALLVLITFMAFASLAFIALIGLASTWLEERAMTRLLLLRKDLEHQSNLIDQLFTKDLLEIMSALDKLTLPDYQKEEKHDINGLLRTALLIKIEDAPHRDVALELQKISKMIEELGISVDERDFFSARFKAAGNILNSRL